MKRLNPNTGKPFKRGDTREDGFIFNSYVHKPRKNGFYINCVIKDFAKNDRCIVSTKI